MFGPYSIDGALILQFGDHITADGFTCLMIYHGLLVGFFICPKTSIMAYEHRIARYIIQIAFTFIPPENVVCQSLMRELIVYFPLSL